jgi:hypothetical protein
MTADVLLATGDEWPDLHPDELLLVDALADRGLRADPAVWTDPSVDWAATRIVVVRAVFDYVRARDEFCAWAERVASVTSLHNPPEVLRWNSHKSYLRDLEADGIPIVPTAWLDAGSSGDLAALLGERGWPDAVVKAAVDNGARAAIRVSLDEPGPGQAHLDSLLQARDVMVQPYVTATEDVGEHALVHIDGVFSHAIRKDQMLAGRPFDIDRIPPIDPEPRELALAERVLARFDDPLLYARVDTICSGEEVMLMELEVLEPVLFFSKAPGSAGRMAAAIEARLG